MTTYMTAMRGVEGDSNVILSGRRTRDVSSKIALLDANQTKLLALLRKLRREKTVDAKFEWQEDVFPAQIVNVSGTDSSTDATVELTAAHAKLGRPGDLWVAGKTGELIYLLANASSTTWTVKRKVGSTTGGPLTDGDELYYVGTAHPMGKTARAQLTTQITQPYNYCQIFKEAFEVTNTLNATNLYGGKDREYLRYKHAQIHNRDIERAFWFGGRDLLTATDDSGTFITTAAHITRGLVGPDGSNGFITSNAQGNASGAYTEDEFDSDLRTIFRYGSETKFAFCAPMALSVISSWGRGKLQVVPRDTTFGINITRYISPHGELNLLNNKLFYDMTDTTEANNIDFTKLVVVLDLENIWYRYLRDTVLEMGIQENDKDAVEDQYLTECGIMCKQEKTHGYITDFDLS